MNKFVNEGYIGLDEAAEYLKTKSTIPVHKIGRLWKFKKIELDEWVKSGKSS